MGLLSNLSRLFGRPEPKRIVVFVPKDGVDIKDVQGPDDIRGIELPRWQERPAWKINDRSTPVGGWTKGSWSFEFTTEPDESGTYWVQVFDNESERNVGEPKSYKDLNDALVEAARLWDITDVPDGQQADP